MFYIRHLPAFAVQPVVSCGEEHDDVWWAVSIQSEFVCGWGESFFPSSFFPRLALGYVREELIPWTRLIPQKVCLSLLGTWQGPGWIAGQSTLLQVLISIQSLIMCEEPYCNEPAWANDAGTPQAKAYDANVRRMVLVDAMAGNIKNPPYPCKLFSSFCA